VSRARPDAHRAIDSLRRLTELFSRRRQQLARSAGITETQWQVLEEVNGEAFMPSMFARNRETSAAAVSRTLRQLLDGDFLRATIDASDGRQRVYRLTAKGRRALAKLAEQRQDAIDDVWAPFGREELCSFSDFADSLSDRLEQYADRR
jgi:DNA-binding MarR family transcriptional regulator